METHRITCINLFGAHEIVCDVFGSTNRKTVFCIHGFTRNRHDFDFAARSLADSGYRVITIDLAGRGESTWFAEESQYEIPQCWIDLITVIKYFNAEDIAIIGTSFGGWMGMFMAVNPAVSVKTLVLNDVGPCLSKELVDAICHYTGETPTFASIDELEQELRARYGGALVAKWNINEEHWHHFALHSSHRLDNGRYCLAYDPKLVTAIGKELHYRAYDMWKVWDRVATPTLVFHGANSPVLTQETIDKMKTRGSREMNVIDIADAGHTPMLCSEFEISAIRDWLDKHL